MDAFRFPVLQFALTSRKKKRRKTKWGIAEVTLTISFSLFFFSLFFSLLFLVYSRFTPGGFRMSYELDVQMGRLATRLDEPFNELLYLGDNEYGRREADKKYKII